MMTRTIAIVLLSTDATAAVAQGIEWEHVVHAPSALSLPQGARIDVLGISAGDTPEQVKAVLEAYAPDEMAAGKPEMSLEQEMMASISGARVRAPFVETERILTLPLSTPIQVRHLARYDLERKFGSETQCRNDFG